jgi:hypothetical protein
MCLKITKAFLNIGQTHLISHCENAENNITPSGLATDLIMFLYNHFSPSGLFNEQQNPKGMT